jgi:hypothetical protein
MVRQYGNHLERVPVKYMSFNNQDLALVGCVVDGHSDAWIRLVTSGETCNFREKQGRPSQTFRGQIVEIEPF